MAIKETSCRATHRITTKYISNIPQSISMPFCSSPIGKPGRFTKTEKDYRSGISLRHGLICWRHEEDSVNASLPSRASHQLGSQYDKEPIPSNTIVRMTMSPDPAVCLHGLIHNMRLLAKRLYYHRRLGRPVVKIWVGGVPFVAEGLQGRHLLFALQSSTFQPPGMQAVLRDPFSIQSRRIAPGIYLESGHLLRSG